MQWEYKAIKFDFTAMFSMNNFDEAEFERHANFYGWEGWEMVNVFDTSISSGTTRYVVAVMKRPVSDQRRAEMAKGAK